MIYYHILENVNYVLPDFVSDLDFIYVKGKRDRMKTAIITKTIYDYPGVTREEMQAILDDWINDENADPEIDQVSGEPIIQSYVSLDSFVRNYEHG